MSATPKPWEAIDPKPLPETIAEGHRLADAWRKPKPDNGAVK